jgi:hypothetical protein
MTATMSPKQWMVALDGDLKGTENVTDGAETHTEGGA